MSEANEAAEPTKRVGFFLTAGIVWLPIIFSWLTLRKGYSKAARAWSLGWLLVTAIPWLLLVSAAEERGARLQANPGLASAKEHKTLKFVDTSLSDEECSRDAVCVAKKLDTGPKVACETLLEREAKYDFKWTNGWGQRKWSSAKWADGYDTPYRVLEIRGTTLKLQNGFGAWSRHAYACEYEPATDLVHKVRIFEGRPETWEASPIK